MSNKFMEYTGMLRKINIDNNKVINIDEDVVGEIESDYIERNANNTAYFLKFNDFEDLSLKISKGDGIDIDPDFFVISVTCEYYRFADLLKTITIDVDDSDILSNLGDLYNLMISCNNSRNVLINLDNVILYMGYKEEFVDEDTDEDEELYELSFCIHPVIYEDELIEYNDDGLEP